MEIRNAKGEITKIVTQKEIDQQLAKKELAEIRKTPPKSIADLTKRIEKIEQYLGI